MTRTPESQASGRLWGSFGLLLLRQLSVGFLILGVLAAIVMVLFALALAGDGSRTPVDRCSAALLRNHRGERAYNCCCVTTLCACTQLRISLPGTGETS